MKRLELLLVALLPMAARTAEMQSTYGQRIVAAVLMGEARGEGEIGMTAVAEVIRNRAREAGQSPLRIVLKKGQFACLKHHTPEALYRKFSTLREYPTALRIARTCYNAPESLPDITKGATFFDVTHHRPPWLGEVRRVASIGNHTFYAPHRGRAAAPPMDAKSPARSPDRDRLRSDGPHPVDRALGR